MTEKSLQQQTLMLELDRKITLITLTLEHDQKNNDFWSYSHVNVCCCGNICYIFGHVNKLMFVVVNFSVMFTDFGHIHSVILIRSSELPSIFFTGWGIL